MARTPTLCDDLALKLLITGNDAKLNIVMKSGQETVNDDGGFIRIVG